MALTVSNRCVEDAQAEKAGREVLDPIFQHFPYVFKKQRKSD
jgi:hypothetical protein